MRLDFHEPETPVTTDKFHTGILTSMFLRLWCVAPCISKNFEMFLFGESTETVLSPLRYGAVTEDVFFINSLRGPVATISHP